MVAEPGHWAERQAPGLIAGGPLPQEVAENTWEMEASRRARRGGTLR